MHKTPRKSISTLLVYTMKSHGTVDTLFELACREQPLVTFVELTAAVGLLMFTLVYILGNRHTLL